MQLEYWSEAILAALEPSESEKRARLCAGWVMQSVDDMKVSTLAAKTCIKYPTTGKSNTKNETEWMVQVVCYRHEKKKRARAQSSC